jgi:hypothetical protein
MDYSAISKVDGIVAVISGVGTGRSFAPIVQSFNSSNRNLGLRLMMAKALAGAGAKKVYILGRR